MRSIASLLVWTGAALIASTATATVVDGWVSNPSNNGVADVDIDFIDRNTGENIPLVNDDTDILGFYAVTVPPGDYDVRFNPPADLRLAAEEVRGVKVQGSSMTLDQQLQSGWFVTGRVIDEGGTPQANVDLDFVEADDGEVYVSNDHTKTTGSFKVTLRPGTYQIEFEPVATSDLVPRRLDDVVVTADVGLGDVALDFGFHLSGIVENVAGAPLDLVLVRTTDPWTGEEIFNIRNRTDGQGAYDFVVSPGWYTLELISPRGARQLPRRLAGVHVEGPTALPSIQLDDGVLARGRVLDPAGDPAEGVDLDFVDRLSGRKIWTPKDNTDDGGDYEIAVPAGTYDLRYDPPPVLDLAPDERLDVSLAVDQSLPNVQLETGHDVTGVVVDAGLTPLAGVDLDFLRSADGVEMPSSRDTTDPLGAFQARVATGTYDIAFNPPDLSGSGRRVEPSVGVSADVDLGTQSLPASVQANPSTITPGGGSETGGTPVTISGLDFVEGVVVRFGGVRAGGVTLVGATTIEAITPPHRVGVVDVEVVNPGATASILPAAFSYQAAAAPPMLTLDKAGPLGTDVLLQWTDTGQTSYSVFRGTSAEAVSSADPLDVVNGSSLRDDTSAGYGSPDVLFYIVQ